MPTAVEEYGAAIEALGRAEKDVTDLIGRLSKATQTLDNHWKRVVTPNSAGRHKRRAHLIPNQRIDEWPDWNLVAARINDYHAALLKVDHAFDALSPAEQKLVQKPPESNYENGSPQGRRRG